MTRDLTRLAADANRRVGVETYGFRHKTFPYPRLSDGSLAIRDLFFCWRFRERRRMSLDLPDCISIIYFLSAIRTFIRLQIGNSIGFPLIFSGPLSPNSLDSVTSTSRTRSNSKHSESFC